MDEHTGFELLPYCSLKELKFVRLNFSSLILAPVSLGLSQTHYPAQGKLRLIKVD